MASQLTPVGLHCHLLKAPEAAGSRAGCFSQVLPPCAATSRLSQQQALPKHSLSGCLLHHEAVSGGPASSSQWAGLPPAVSLCSIRRQGGCSEQVLRPTLALPDRNWLCLT